MLFILFSLLYAAVERSSATPPPCKLLDLGVSFEAYSSAMVSGTYLPLPDAWNGKPTYADRFGNVVYYSSLPHLPGWVVAKSKITGALSTRCPEIILVQQSGAGDTPYPPTGNYLRVAGDTCAPDPSLGQAAVQATCLPDGSADESSWDSGQCPPLTVACAQPADACLVIDTSINVSSTLLSKFLCFGRRLTQGAVPTNGNGSLAVWSFSNGMPMTQTPTRDRFGYWDSGALSSFKMPKGPYDTQLGTCTHGQGLVKAAGTCVLPTDNVSCPHVEYYQHRIGDCPYSNESVPTVCCPADFLSYNRYAPEHETEWPQVDLWTAVKGCAGVLKQGYREKDGKTRFMFILTQSLSTEPPPCTEGDDDCIAKRELKGITTRVYSLEDPQHPPMNAKRKAEYKVYDPSFEFLDNAEALMSTDTPVRPLLACGGAHLVESQIPLISVSPFVPQVPVRPPPTSEAPPPPLPPAPKAVVPAPPSLPDGPNPIIPMFAALGVLLLLTLIAIGAVYALRRELGLAKERENPLETDDFFAKHGAGQWGDDDDDDDKAL